MLVNLWHLEMEAVSSDCVWAKPVFVCNISTHNGQWGAAENKFLKSNSKSIIVCGGWGRREHLEYWMQVNQFPHSQFYVPDIYICTVRYIHSWLHTWIVNNAQARVQERCLPLRLQIPNQQKNDQIAIHGVEYKIWTCTGGAWEALTLEFGSNQTECKYESNLLRSCGLENGENQASENLPNTAWMLFQRLFFTQRASSFFSCSIP